MYQEFKQKVDGLAQVYGELNYISYMKEDATTDVMSYNEMYHIMCVAKAKLEEIGLKRGERVALISAISPATLLTGECLAYSGITSVLLDASLPAEELVRLVTFSDVRAIFASREIYEMLKDALQDTLDFFKLIESDKLESFDEVPIKQLKSSETKDPEEDVIAIIFSSGTTGTMKGIKVTYKSVVVSDGIFNKILGDKEKCKFLYAFPYNHIAGFILYYIFLFRGCDMGLIENMNASKLQRALLEFEPHIFGMVPKVFEVMEQKIRAALREKGKVVEAVINGLLNFCYFLRKNFGINLGKPLFKGIRNMVFGTNIVCVGGGGTKFSGSNARFFFSLGLDWLDVYASTETSVPCVATCYDDKMVVDTEGNVYKMPGIEIVIGNPDENGVGEVLVKSELMMKGYFRQPELTKEAFDENGYFKTGDAGYIDKKGLLHVTGRIKESIVLQSGKKVSPVDVDSYYFAQLPEYEMASKGITDEDNQYDRIHMFVQNNHYDEETQEHIREEIMGIAAQAPAMYQLSAVHFVHKIEKTSIGKVKRFLLEIEEDTKQEEVVEKGNLSDKEKFLNMVLAKTALTEIDMEQRLKEDLGIESLSMYELITELEGEFSVQLASATEEMTTVGELYALVKNGSFSTTKGNSVDITKYPLVKSVRDTKRLIRIMKMTHKLWAFKVKGLEKVSEKERYIICPNHECHFDGLFVFSALYQAGKLEPDKICCMAKKEHLDHRITRDWLKLLGGIPVDRFGMSAPAIQRSKECIREGYTFLIHPEGTRTRTGELGSFKSGAAAISAETEQKILPVRIDGAYEIYPYSRLLPRFFDWKHFKKYELHIQFGNPISVMGRSTEEVTEELRQAIVQMGEEK